MAEATTGGTPTFATMKRIFLASVMLCSTLVSYGWGKTGHRVVGLIAERHLTAKAKRNIQKVLGHETLAEVSNYMDFIRSNKQYAYMDPWHYCTIPDSLTYEQAGTPEQGDAVAAMTRMIAELKTKQFQYENEAFVLKCLVHLIGDIHQPLHVGNGNDKGGNDVKLEYFWKNTNLHAIWDSGIIDGQELSYTEYVEWINHATGDQKAQWQQDPLMSWVEESKEYRNQCYDYPSNGKLSYRYDFDNLELVNLRLLQAGIRLAKVLNDIYG